MKQTPTNKLKEQGYRDALAGKPIDAFPAKKGELKRGSYEIGWRSGKRERDKNHRNTTP